MLSIRSIPKDEVWLSRFFEEDLKKGRITTPLEIGDVWPENYSSNSAQKVWAAKFAAHHPNVVVLDLSSFKCGHDAPTYGIIDGIIGTAQMPYSALHDIDANKPGGSIKIRVKTYAHSLTLHKERLEDVSSGKQTLLNEIDKKRLTLLAMKAKQLAERSQKDPAVERQIAGDHRSREGIREVTREADGSGAGVRGPRRNEEARDRPARHPKPGRTGQTDRYRAGPQPGLTHFRRRRHMGTAKDQPSFRLPILGEDVTSALAGDIDIDAELRKLDEEAALGSRPGGAIQTDHWYDQMVNPQFTKSQRERTTLLVSGLTAAHDYLVKGALTGLGYNVEVIDVPDNDALRYGKEFGNRGQCNPTYFTVGNLVKFLTERAEQDKLSQSDMVEKYVFLTAGACGPCRFGMYATEYRKALRDAGFDGFRVMLFQQKGGLKQATGEEAGLEMNPGFFIGLLKAILAGDVINGMGYRMRPFEVEAGATDRAIENTKRYVHDALIGGKSVLAALLRGVASSARSSSTGRAPRHACRSSASSGP